MPTGGSSHSTAELRNTTVGRQPRAELGQGKTTGAITIGGYVGGRNLVGAFKFGCGSFEGASRNVRSGVPGPLRAPVRGLPAVHQLIGVARCPPSGRPTCALAEDLVRIL